jgi:hypothetical protein
MNKAYTNIFYGISGLRIPFAWNAATPSLPTPRQNYVFCWATPARHRERSGPPSSRAGEADGRGVRVGPTKEPRLRVSAAKKSGSGDQHGVPITIETVFFLDGPSVCVFDQVQAPKGRDQEEQGGPGQMKICDHAIHHLE